MRYASTKAWGLSTNESKEQKTITRAIILLVINLLFSVWPPFTVFDLDGTGRNHIHARVNMLTNIFYFFILDNSYVNYYFGL